MNYRIIFILSISLFISMGTFAQSQYNNDGFYDYIISYYQGFTTDDPVQKLTVVYTTKRGKTRTTKSEYDSEGKIIKMYFSNNKGQAYLQDSITYDQKTNKIASTYYYNKKGNLNFSMNYLWNSDSVLVELLSTNKKGKIDSKSTWQYNDAGKIQESLRYGKGGKKLKYTWKYVYDEKDELLQTHLFKANGKLKHIWDFNCHQEGEMLNKEKNTTQVCTWSEDRGKYLIKTYQRFNKKGKIRKYVSYYTLNDTILVELKTYNNTDKLISHIKYNSDKKITFSEKFRNGKSKSKIINTYNAKGKKTHYAFYRGQKLIKENIYKFNDNNKLLEEVYNFKGEFKSKKIFTYGDNNLIASYKKYNKKMKLVGSSIYSYVMYEE